MNQADTTIANQLRESIEKAIKSGNSPENAINDYKGFLNAVGIRQDVENPRPPSASIATGIRQLEPGEPYPYPETPISAHNYGTEREAPQEGLHHSLDKLFHNLNRLKKASAIVAEKTLPIRFISPVGNGCQDGCSVGAVSEIDNRIRVANSIVEEEIAQLEILASEIRI